VFLSVRSGKARTRQGSYLKEKEESRSEIVSSRNNIPQNIAPSLDSGQRTRQEAMREDQR